MVLDANLRKTRGVSRNDVACAPALFNPSDSVSANGASDVAVDDAGCA